MANRLAKAAVTEGLADARGWPTPELERLYSDWASAGFGLVITGNIIVDGDHLERPGNVIIDDEPASEHLDKLRSWTRAAKTGGAHVWAQLSHSGRQTPRPVNPRPQSPSALRVDLPGNLFGDPREMTPAEISAVIQKFVSAARICKLAGFTGVQIHAAHGYLISSFLSPTTNLRTDQWGGSLKNRARLLMSIVVAVRKTVGPEFPISVKLNSADFQRAGFGPGESEIVAWNLQLAGVDLLEVSGGSYESPAMVGEGGGGLNTAPAPKKASTLAREAYFLDFARSLRRRVKMPVMLTGGLRTREGMQAALDEGVDVLGVARPVCVDPGCVKPLLSGEVDSLPAWEEQLRRQQGLLSSNSPIRYIRTLASFSGIYWFYAQIYRLGRGQPANLKLSSPLAMLEVQSTEKRILTARLALAPGNKRANGRAAEARTADGRARTRSISLRESPNAR